jgi:hypothetical protein
MRPDEHILVNDNFFESVRRPSWPPVKVSKYGGPESNGAIISDKDRFRVQFVNVHKLADPHTFADVGPSHPLYPGPDGITAGQNIGQLEKNAADKLRKHSLTPP